MRILSLFFLVGFILQTNFSDAQKPPSLPPNQLVLPVSNAIIGFIWKGDSILGKWNPYTALLIPVKLPNCSKQLYMQFDLGSPVSMLYKNPLLQIARRYPTVAQLLDSSTTLRDFKFSIGEMTITASEIMLRELGRSKIDWSHNSIEIIGTLGADLIENKVLMLDYPHQSLSLSEKIPVQFSETVFEDFIWAGRRVLLPAVMKSKKTFLLFDTGASMFELITDQETALSLAVNGSVAERYPVQSWGRTMTANTLPAKDSIGFASQKLLLGNVTWFDGASEDQVSQMKRTGMGGMIGNKLFINSILVLDTKNKKFNVINAK